MPRSTAITNLKRGASEEGEERPRHPHTTQHQAKVYVSSQLGPGFGTEPDTARDIMRSSPSVGPCHKKLLTVVLIPRP